MTSAERYEQAFRALCQNAIDEYAAGIDYETDEYLRVNRAIPEARRGVPQWRRILIDRRVIGELDYWALTGQVPARGTLAFLASELAPRALARSLRHTRWAHIRTLPRRIAEVCAGLWRIAAGMFR